MKEKIQIAALVFSSFILTWLLLSGINLTMTPLGEDLAPTNIVNFFFATPFLYYISMLIMGFTFVWVIISSQQQKETH
ncbi:MAG: hypothetical protein P8J32_04740 [bacterium]|nr:hypothetical protein [bacterium]